MTGPRIVLALAGALLATPIAASASAQDYPSRPVKIIVPFGAGGPADVAARQIGNILQDEKIPGIHIAFGNPYAAHTGADWYSATHIDVVGRNFDIWIDGRQIMRGGALLFDSLASAEV